MLEWLWIAGEREGGQGRPAIGERGNGWEGWRLRSRVHTEYNSDPGVPPRTRPRSSLCAAKSCFPRVCKCLGWNGLRDYLFRGQPIVRTRIICQERGNGTYTYHSRGRKSVSEALHHFHHLNPLSSRTFRDSVTFLSLLCNTAMRHRSRPFLAVPIGSLPSLPFLLVPSPFLSVPLFSSPLCPSLFS
jgi:hypothetical protein